MDTFEKLNLPDVALRLKQDGQTFYVFDTIRKKWLVLTPEEWVRQHFVHYLIHHKNYPPSLISLEAALKYNRLSKRSDVLIFNKLGKPLLIVECKAAKVNIEQKVIEQVSVYNKTIGAKFLCVSNGMSHYCWTMNENNQKFDFLKQIPDYNEIKV